MKVWVVGGLGMVGTSLCRFLRKKGVAYVGSTRTQADITSLKSLESFSDRYPDLTHIVNCAAYTQVDRAEEEPERAFAVNALGPENLAKLARKKTLSLLHLSSDYVFDGYQRTPYREEDLPSPLSTYGKTKREGEVRLLDIFPSGCILRTSWLFGFGGRNFVTSIVEALLTKNEVRIVDDQRGRPTFCEDLVYTLWNLLFHQGIFHFANAGEVSWFTFGQQIQKELSTMGKELVCTSLVPILSKDYSSRAPRPSYSVLETKKIELLYQNDLALGRFDLEKVPELFHSSSTPVSDLFDRQWKIRHWSEALHSYLQALIPRKRI